MFNCLKQIKEANIIKHFIYFKTPVGDVTIADNGTSITNLSFGKLCFESSIYGETPLLNQAQQELQEYFLGERKYFTLPVAPSGTAFQQKVWAELLNIPWGETRSYRQIAQAINNPRAYRAVGMANHNNPIAIMIPCHRVIGATGALVGYGGGLDIKQKLLELEHQS